MIAQKRLYTAGDLWTRSHQGGESVCLELVQGEIVAMAPTGGQLFAVLAEEGDRSAQNRSGN